MVRSGARKGLRSAWATLLRANWMAVAGQATLARRLAGVSLARAALLPSAPVVLTLATTETAVSTAKPRAQVTALLAALTLTAGSAMAADPVPVAGRQLMTEQEQAQMRTRMRNATTEEERARIRAEEHALIRERAAAQGITLPETPPAQGQGLGLGQGTGQGMGQGQGPGPGASGAGAGTGPGAAGGMGQGQGRMNKR